MTKAARSRPRAERSTTPAGHAGPSAADPAAIAYVPFEAADFVETEDGHWQASRAAIPSDHVERIQMSITLKPGVRLQNVGRTCAHAAVDVTTHPRQ